MQSDEDSDDEPLSVRLARTSSDNVAPVPPVAPAPAPVPIPAPASAIDAAPAEATAKKRKRPAAAAAKPTASGVSGRAARGGAGGFSLNEAAGDLDADYETLGVLGRGNFSEVNLVRHRTTKTLCALKFCCKLDIPCFTHLRAEATLASRVQHPFVLSPLAVADSPGRAGNFSVLLPLCPGGDLRQLLRRKRDQRLAEGDVRHYTAMVVLGLEAIHTAGLAYRDLKPENLLIKANGYLCIADFGFTAPLSECRRAKIGTAMYIAPELLRKLPHGIAVDWWALGCVSHEMARGASPFMRDDDDDTEAAVLAHEAGALLAAPAPPKPPLPAEQAVAADESTPPESAAAVSLPSAELVSLWAALLHPNVAERLGSATAGGIGALKGHAWFAGTDWEACLAMTTPAPSVPPSLDAMDADATLIKLSACCQNGFD